MIVSRRRVLGALAATFAGTLPRQPRAAKAEGQSHRLLRIMVVGDSLAQGLAASLQRRSRQVPGLDIIPSGIHSTGFTRYHELDWEAKLEELVAEHHPDAVVMWMGLNDFRAIADPEARRRYGFNSPDWVRIYAARIDALIGTLKRAGIPLYWVGLPVLRDETYNEGVRVIDRLQRDQVAARDETWVPVVAATTAPDGSYMPYLPDTGAGIRRLRADDGAHFARAGYRIVADLVLAKIRARQPAPTSAGLP